MRIITGAVLFCASLLLFAQTTPNEPYEGSGYESSGYMISMPSPTAASLGEYGQYSVGGSTGLPGINIPLFDIKGYQLSVPISLSYSSSGVKVNDVASWVGMGWSLNSGGVVTRSIMGNPDEDAGLHVLYNGFGFDPLTFDPQEEVDTGSPGFGTMMAGGTHKGLSDLYSFNFLGYSGQFYVDHSNNVHLFEESDISVTRSSVNNSGMMHYTFTIKTGDGITATFDAEEVTDYGTGDGNSYIAETAWYLTSLSKGDDTFTFSYATESIDYGYTYSETEFLPAMGPVTCISMGNQDIYGATNSVEKKRLTSISGPFGTATFIPSATNRLDIGGKKLAFINYSNVANTLDIDVTINSSFDDGVYKPSRYGTRERLFLNSVSIQAGGDSKTYSFDYNPEDLPPTNAYAQDHWGYYNGANNSTLKPVVEGWSGGANRGADPAYMEAGILTRVTYPTGGYTDFDWEPNYGQFDGVERQCSNVNTNIGGNSLSFAWTQTKIVTLTGTDTYMTIAYNVGEGMTPEQEPGQLGVVVKDPQNNIIYETVNPEWLSGIGLIEVPAGSGQYTIILSNETGANLSDLDVDISKCDDVAVIENRYFGGLRIAQIDNYDSPSNLATSVSYEYGDLMTARSIIPQDYINYFSVNCADEIANIKGVKRRSSNPRQSISNSVSYTWVRETYQDGSSKKNTYYPLGDWQIVYGYPRQDRSSFRSKPILIELFDDQGSLVKTDQFNYTLVNRDEYMGVEITEVIRNTSPVSLQFVSIRHQITSVKSDWLRLDQVVSTEYFPSGNLVTTQDFAYYRSETPLDSHVQAGEVTTTYPDGKVRSQITIYPRDINSGSSNLWNTLASEFWLRPIESVLYDPDADQIISAKRIEYNTLGVPRKQWTLDAGNGIPESTFIFSSGSTDLSARGDYYENSMFGSEEVSIDYISHRTVDILPSNGVNVSYIWGYNNRYPVAQFSNVSYSWLLTNALSQINSINASNNTSNIRSWLNQIAAILPDDSLYKFYLHDPGLGVIETIDSNGEKTTYQYDDFGRLIRAKDDDGYILQEYEYNYGSN